MPISDLVASVKEYFISTTALQITLMMCSLLAIIELVLFTLAVLCTFANVLRSPDASTSRSRLVFTCIKYLVFRCIPVPFILAGLTVHTGIIQVYMPIIVRGCVVIMGIWLNFTISLPCFTTFYSRYRYGIGNTKLASPNKWFDFIVLLPVYNETYELLVAGVQSIIDQDYPRDRMTIHISFDSDERSDLYISLLEYLHFSNPKHVDDETVFGYYMGVLVYVHKFPHGGKRKTQSKTFDYLEKRCNFDWANAILVFLDSDNYTYDCAFHNLASTFDRNPKKLALAGFMTCMSSGKLKWNLFNLVQDVEYCSGESNRSFELLMGTVNCLPGGFTALRYEVMYTRFSNDETVMEKYFGPLPDKTITDFHRNYLGEDRYLTHLLHQALPKHSLGFSPAARAKTDPPPTFKGMVRQRRRWFLGALSNEVYMITDAVIGKKYSFLVFFKTFQMAFRCNFFSQVVLSIFAISSVDYTDFWSAMSLFVSAGIPLLLNWIAAICTGIKLGHYKVIVLQPVMLVMCSVMQVFIDYYALVTFRQRSWGGVRMQSNV